MATADQKPYGTFVNEESFETYRWESQGDPWKLFITAGMSVSKNVLAVMLLFYAMGLNREQLLACDARVLSMFTACACEYTKAFLRTFALLAINMSLTVAMRIILQQRIYYGMLKAGALLDFGTVKVLSDPTFWLLAISLLHGILHFVLKYYSTEAFRTATWRDDFSELKQVCKSFIAPACIFLVFFYSSWDIEASLVPLNKYFEEDWEAAKHALGSITPVDENVLWQLVEEHDVVAQAEQPHIRAVYRALVKEYPICADRSPGEPKLWFNEMWPARILLDPRLEDEDSQGFRRMFAVFLVLCLTVQIGTLGFFSYQAWKDIYLDFWIEGHAEDLLSFLVLGTHALILCFLIFVCIRRTALWRMSTCCLTRAAERELPFSASSSC